MTESSAPRPAPAEPDSARGPAPSDPTADPAAAAVSAAPSEPEPDKGMPTLWEQMGGIVGFVSASIPVVFFVIVNAFAGMQPAIWTALGVAAAITVWRLARKEALQPAISGFIGVGIAAFIANQVGAAKGFFLYGIWVSALFGCLFAVSLIVRWPLAGVLWSVLNGSGFGWRSDRGSRLRYDLATLTWTLVFAARFVVQNWLYDADKTTLLGIARIAMGYPLMVVALLVTAWAVRHAAKIEKQSEQQALGGDTAPSSA